MSYSTLEEWWGGVGERELRLILWAAWDPIGRVPRDEYDRYVPQLWGLIKEHANALRVPDNYERLPQAEQDALTDAAIRSQQRIADRLGEWRTDQMGLPSCPSADEEVARKISDWLSPPGVAEFRACDLA